MVFGIIRALVRGICVCGMRLRLLDMPALDVTVLLLSGTVADLCLVVMVMLFQYKKKEMLCAILISVPPEE